ncbi:MAG: chromosomal replication initiator protein DnaA [Lachnospiraceae bacterium]|nr:chromosomal replication initiator protein DnaA [Lachnospiraceae bacterium]
MENVIKEKWNDILKYMKEEYSITDVAYRTWLLPLSVCSITGNTIIICVDDFKIGAASLDFIKNKYETFLRTAIAEVTGKDYEISFELKSRINDNTKVTINEPSHDLYGILNPKYTFETFVIGSNNSLAHAAAVAVSENPAEVYNPLFIYGGVGLGKTHLMQSIAHHILEMQKGKKVIYITSEAFTNELVQSIRNNKNDEFRQKYRSADVLLIDDIQFIINKKSTQEEFFFTFNALYESKKQIIISSDRPPKEMDILDERLSSRFQMGLTVDISAPDYETRLSILTKRVEDNAINIEYSILQLIAEKVTSNVRLLAAALDKVIALSRLKHKEITMELALEAIHDYIEDTNSNKKAITLSYIVDVVAEHYELTSQEIFSKNRTAKIAYPRHIAIYLCKKYLDMSLTEIGKSFGGRDHTTIINSINRIEKELKSDPILDDNIKMIIKKINPC